jgi:hypothetical protein
MLHVKISKKDFNFDKPFPSSPLQGGSGNAFTKVVVFAVHGSGHFQSNHLFIAVQAGYRAGLALSWRDH